jgi:hypothetical protein
MQITPGLRGDICMLEFRGLQMLRLWKLIDETHSGKCLCAFPVTPSMHRKHFTKTTGDFSKNAGGATTFSAMNKKLAGKCTQIHPRVYVSSVEKTEN